MIVIRNLRLSIAILSIVILISSCRDTQESQKPQNGGILTPLTDSTGGNGGGSNKQANYEEEAVLPLVNPGENFNILALLDGNLDLEQSDEQVLVALPLDDPDAPLEIMIASTNPIRNQYDIVWTAPLSTRTLTGITLRSDDLTGNGRNDLIVAGFDERGRHVTDAYAVRKKGTISGFVKVFSLAVDGNVDIITSDRSPAYYSGLSAGVPHRIVVQKKNPDSENTLDLIETDWLWDTGSFLFRQGESREVQGAAILEERIGRVYSGDVEIYEEYLRGAWYRETGTGSYLDMLYFDPDAREILFYDGSIQEVFTWGTSHRTTAKRLYTRVNNSVIPSMFDTVSVSAESWERIELWRAATNWNGIYRRLGPALQQILDSESSLSPLVSPLELTGVWRSPGGTEIVFDLPHIEWKENEKSRIGTASLFSLGDAMVLQIQYMKKNGAVEDTVNWIAEYDEDRDSTRVIRSLSLSPALLSVNGIRTSGGAMRRFEQIEIISPSE